MGFFCCWFFLGFFFRLCEVKRKLTGNLEINEINPRFLQLSSTLSLLILEYYPEFFKPLCLVIMLYRHPRFACVFSLQLPI